jgi:hypothetical protein
MTLDDVSFVRSELGTALRRYVIVRDCVEQRVKDKAQTYLPEPSVEADETARRERYNAYLLRAVFYAVTSRTLLGMLGQIYAGVVTVKLPEDIKYMLDDATGSGLSLEQLSKDTLNDVIAVGRAGIYVDYPTTDGPVTRKQQIDGTVRPTMTTYRPENIINWREKQRDSLTVLCLVVLREFVDVEGEFSREQVEQFRELRLETFDGVDRYAVRAWQFTDKVQANGKPIRTWTQQNTTAYPLNGRGAFFDTIPFAFVGSTNNDASIDPAPLYDLAELNLAHYRNSADYEESCFIVGQPTPWFSGLTEEWVTDVLKGKVLLGSRSAVLLPENSMAGLLQVAANSMPMEAMKHKESQMVALGARLVENRQVRRTLGEVQQSNASETSILATCANNTSTAYTRMLRYAASFVGADESACEFTLPTDFAMTQMSAEERMQLIAELQSGARSFTETRDLLRRSGLVSQDDATALAEINTELDAKAKREAANAPKPVPVARPDNRAVT